MTLFEWQQTLGLILTLIIGVLLHALYRRRVMTPPLMWALMLVVAHGVVFSGVVLYRHLALGYHDPSPVMTSWSSIWRVHALGTIVGVLWAILERERD